MSLEIALENITARLRQDSFPNEQAVSQGIVLRLLQELGWDTWDTTVVWPEYQTGEGRADFALCHPPSKPAVFIEVKQPGKAEEGVHQALTYAFHAGGVPFTVLTDGRTWSFYLPAERGSYEDRRVYKLDLFERPPKESAEALARYLSSARVKSGEALLEAQREYRDQARRAEARKAIPEVWRELVEKGNEALVELLASAVESKVGIRPQDDDVAAFLVTLGGRMNPQPADEIGPRAPRPEPQPPGPGPVLRRTVIIRGHSYPCKNAKEAMVTVLKELAKNDPSFLERCSRHRDASGYKRHCIARRPEDLYPDRPDLQGLHEALPGGWLISTNLNNQLKKTIIRLAAEVAGLTFGKDVQVDF